MKERHDTSTNESRNATFSTILSQALSRRQVLQGGLLAAGMALFGGSTGVWPRPQCRGRDLALRL